MNLQDIKTSLIKLSKLSPESDEFIKEYVQIKLFQFLNPKAIDELGWQECVIANSFYPKSEMVEVFNNYYQYTSKNPLGYFHPTNLDKFNFASYIYYDEVNQCFILAATDKSVQIIMSLSDDKYVTTSQSFAKERARSSRVARDVTIYHLFESYFKNHEAAVRKAYEKPEGEAFGIEIEMRFPDVFSKLRFSNYVGVNFPDWTTERDGSLEDKGRAGLGGLELVSPPLSYSKILTELDPILKEARGQKGIGHEAGVFYGIHLNVNIYGNKKSDTARRFICLINDPQLRVFWETLSRRRGSAAMQEYCQFQNVLPETCLATEAYNHYRATYYRTDKNGAATNCVEVRIFRSNLKFSSVKITIEIMKLTLDFCMGSDNINDYSAFRDFLLCRASDDLKKYIFSSDCAFELDRAARITNEAKFGNQLSNFIN